MEGAIKPQPTRPRRRRGSLVASLGLFVLIGGGILAGSVFAYRHFSRPAIIRLDPPLAEPGSILRIEGRGFGEERGDSRVEIDGTSPTSSSYLSWTATAISIRLPSTLDSGLVYVLTRYGRSNAKLFMNRSRLPVRVESGAGGESGPFLASLSAEKGSVGSLLVLSGRSFGGSRENGAVYFARSSEEGSGAGAGAQRSELPIVSNAETDLGYELWSDKEIRVRVPDGATSGAVYVSTQAGKSNAIFFSVEGSPGSKRFFDRRSYSIAYSVGVSKIQASGGNELYLWVPRPVDYAAQGIARVLSQEPSPLVPDYRGSSLYRFKNLATGGDATVSLSYLVQTYAVETQVNPDKIQRPLDPPPLVAAYTLPDELVPSAAPAIQTLARRIVGGEKNPWRAARLVYDYLTRNLVWIETREPLKPLEALEKKTADSSSFAVLAAALLRASGIPALPLTGLLVDASRRTARHSWLEFYVYGLGWVPMDPVLGGGARPGGFQPPFEELGRYFGGVDSHRIAFSRGYAVLAPMAASGRRASPSRPLAYQSFFEEAAGSLEAYSSFWSEVEVTGLY